MDIRLMDKNLSEDSFQEYIEKIVNIFRLSSKNSSILFDLKIIDYQATIKLSIVNQDGEREEFHDVVLHCDSPFYHQFLIPLVQRINDTVEVKTKDIVKLTDSSLVTFRMITENNDLFSVDGLSKDDAKNLLSLLKKDVILEEKTSIVPNNSGSGSVFAFLLMIGVLIITFILIVTFID